MRRQVSVNHVDEGLTVQHYARCMRRLWLTILAIVALTASGFVSAVAAQSCPMLNGAASMQDCSSMDSMQMNGVQGAPKKHAPASNSDKMSGCYLGQACRSAPVVTPTLEPLRISVVAIVQPRLQIDTPAPATGSVRDFWRPPRSI